MNNKIPSKNTNLTLNSNTIYLYDLDLGQGGQHICSKLGKSINIPVPSVTITKYWKWKLKYKLNPVSFNANL